MMALFLKTRNEVAGLSLIQVSNLTRCAGLKACHLIANSRTSSMTGKRDGSDVPAPVLLIGGAHKNGGLLGNGEDWTGRHGRWGRVRSQQCGLRSQWCHVGGDSYI